MVLTFPRHAAEWGEEYDSIVYHEKQQFFRLPPLVKDLCGDSNNSARHTGDIYVRRFWAPYLYVNVCIQQKKAIQTANTDLVKYTELRFSHLAKPNDHPGSLAEYSRVSVDLLWQRLTCCGSDLTLSYSSADEEFLQHG